MGPKLFAILCALCGLIGCFDDALEETDGIDPDLNAIDDEKSEGGGGTAKGILVSEDDSDSGFDPCPDVTYILRDPAGNPVVVVLEVFCEPMQDMNLGCPGP